MYWDSGVRLTYERIEQMVKCSQDPRLTGRYVKARLQGKEYPALWAFVGHTVRTKRGSYHGFSNGQIGRIIDVDGPRNFIVRVPRSGNQCAKGGRLWKDAQTIRIEDLRFRQPRRSYDATCTHPTTSK